MFFETKISENALKNTLKNGDINDIYTLLDKID